MSEHWLWWILAMACLVWYSTITVYIAIRGLADIRTMLRHLKEKQSDTAKSAKPTADKPKP